MTVFRWLLSPLCWREVWQTSVWRYDLNTATGRRRVVRVSPSGHQPINLMWFSQGRS